jgi:hypothetical protein
LSVGVGVDLVGEGRDRVDCQRGDSAAARVAGQPDDDVVRREAIADQAVGRLVEVDRVVGAELTVGREQQVDMVAAGDGRPLPVLDDRGDQPLVADKGGLRGRQGIRRTV